MFYEENYQCQIDINTLDATSVYYQSTTGRGFPSHSHSYYEIRYYQNGSCEFEINNQRIAVPEKSLLFIPPLTIHSFNAETFPSNILQIQFIPRMLGVSHLAQNVPILTPAGTLADNKILQITDGSPMENILNKMISYVPSAILTVERPDCEISVDAFTPPIRLKQCTDIFCLLSCMLEDGTLRIDYMDRHSTMYGAFQKLLEYILNNPENEMSAKEAADFVHMSYYDFSRNFAQKCGATYIHLVNRVKIQRAKDLLNNTSMSVTDISSALNFSSVSYFNQVFKKYVGLAPLAYRANAHRHIS